MRIPGDCADPGARTSTTPSILEAIAAIGAGAELKRAAGFPARTADGRLQDAIVRLLKSRPFYGHFLLGFRRRLIG